MGVDEEEEMSGKWLNLKKRFKYNETVKIVGGFYEGQEGVVIKETLRTRFHSYNIKLADDHIAEDVINEDIVST